MSATSGASEATESCACTTKCSVRTECHGWLKIPSDAAVVGSKSPAMATAKASLGAHGPTADRCRARIVFNDGVPGG